MTGPKVRVEALSRDDKRQYAKRLLHERAKQAAASDRARVEGKVKADRDIPEAFYRFDQNPDYERIRLMKEAGERMGVPNPYLRTYDGIAGNTTRIAGKEYINYANTNFLEFSGHPKVARAAKAALDKYGTSVSASRIVSGQRPIHLELEREIAEILGADDSIVFTTGFTANVTTVGHLFGPKDLILHDELIHNSVLQGSILSGARRIPFPHSDWHAVDALLKEHRLEYQRVVVIIEGLYGMDGDVPEVPPLIKIKNRHKVFLMIDEAHTMGILGERGFGIGEYFGINADEVDLWMGTLSKAFASCGGYIAGCKELIDYLRYSAPAAVYSVGVSPVNAAAAVASIRLLRSEPERVLRLQKNARLFLELARDRGLDTGLSMGISIVPVIIGSTILSVLLSNALLDRGINVQPILHPAVAESATRLRFFFSCGHSEEQIRYTVDAVVEELERLRQS